MSDADRLKSEILRLTREYSALAHRGNLPASCAEHTTFVPGQTAIPYAGRVFDADRKSVV